MFVKQQVLMQQTWPCLKILVSNFLEPWFRRIKENADCHSVSSKCVWEYVRVECVWVRVWVCISECESCVYKWVYARVSVWVWVSVCERVRTRKCVCVHVKNQVLYQSRPGAHSTVFIIWISLLYLTRQQIKNKKICREREKAKINWKDNERDWIEQWFSISAFTFGCFRQIHSRSLMVCPLSAFNSSVN